VLGGWSAVMWTSVASHSRWEMAVGSLCTLLALVGLYWMIAALRGWRPFRPTAVLLLRRVYRVSNRLCRSLPQRADRLPYRIPSAYGMTDSIELSLLELQHPWRQPRTIVRMPYTMWWTGRRVSKVVRALGEHGVTDDALRPYLNRPPKKEEVRDVASLLVRASGNLHVTGVRST
jgi:hypothetical protein